MSAGDTTAIVTQLALAADGAVLGIALAYFAVRSFFKFAGTSSALRRISDAPSVNVSDLRSVLSDGDREPKLVVVRGTVETKSAVDGSWKKSLWPDVLVSRDSSEKAVVLQRTQKYIYNEWRWFFGWYPDLRAVLARTWKEQGSTSMRTVPFVLVEDHQQPWCEYVAVELDGSKHQLPLTTVYQKMQPISASPYTFLQALFGHEYPVGLLEEEKILPIGMEVAAVGICSPRNGVPEIKSCGDLPYFLSEMTKDQMVVELSFRMKVLLWSGIVVGSMSVGVLGYAIVRNWRKWKRWREQRMSQQQNRGDDVGGSSAAEPEVVVDEDIGDLPDGQLCVICLMRRRRCAFIPCGHLVCCERCALSVEQDVAPKCPVCRQTIRSSVRIYDS